MRRAFIDIETSALPDELLERVKPEFAAPSNIKDPVKIAAAIADKAIEWKERAALKAVTGKIVAYSFARDHEPTNFLCYDNESQLILALCQDNEVSLGTGATI